jgi:hypothetical protein
MNEREREALFGVLFGFAIGSAIVVLWMIWRGV